MSTTLCIVSYGYGHLVAHAIDTALAQTVQPDRILVVDDGAQDGVKKIATKMGVDVIERPSRMGVVNNFQDILMHRVETDRLMMLGADNWLHPKCFETLTPINADIVTYPLFIVGEEANSYHKISKCIDQYGYLVRKFGPYENIQQRIRRSNVIHGSSLYNVELAREVGGYLQHPGKTRPEEDWFLWKRMIAAGATYHAIEEPLMYYRRHKANFLGIY